MGIILTIIIGFIVGLIARAVMPGKDVSGFIWTTLLGIAGAFVGKYVGLGLGLYHDDQPAGFFMSIVGALILLLIYHLIRRNSANPPS
jgi:uncharacterized membrane protein YeaQ/YmgE (transglycosylase-associated protein family)